MILSSRETHSYEQDSDEHTVIVWNGSSNWLYDSQSAKFKFNKQGLFADEPVLDKKGKTCS